MGSSDRASCVRDGGWSYGIGTMQENEANQEESVLTLDSDIAGLEQLSAFIDSFCKLGELPKETCYQLQVALEELILNAIKYGGCEPKKGAIRLAMRKEGDEVRIVLSDSGIPFNPLEAPSPDFTESLQDRPLGGLGIHLVRHFMPSIRYERRGARNYLYLARPVNPELGKVSPEGGTHESGDGDN